MALFTQDPATIAAGVHAIRVLALYRVLMTLGMVMDGGLTGAGDTVSPMVVNFIALWLVMLPAVWLLSTYFGLGRERHLVGAGDRHGRAGAADDAALPARPLAAAAHLSGRRAGAAHRGAFCFTARSNDSRSNSMARATSAGSRR